MTRVVALLTSLCALGLCTGPARAQEVALRDGEIALTVGYPLTIGATYVHVFGELPVAFGVQLVPDAEGGSLSVGVRPSLVRAAPYELIWASEVGALVYGRDGESVGVRASSSLLSVFAADPIYVALTPRLDFAGAGGVQEGWRLRTTLALAVGAMWREGAIWIECEAGYTFDDRSAGAFRLAAALVLSIRPAELR